MADLDFDNFEDVVEPEDLGQEAAVSYEFPPMPVEATELGFEPVALLSEPERIEKQLTGLNEASEAPTISVAKSATEAVKRQIAADYDVPIKSGNDLVPALIRMGYKQLDQGRNWLFVRGGPLVSTPNMDVDPANGTLTTMPEPRSVDIANTVENNKQQLARALPADTMNSLLAVAPVAPVVAGATATTGLVSRPRPGVRPTATTSAAPAPGAGAGAGAGAGLRPRPRFVPGGAASIPVSAPAPGATAETTRRYNRVGVLAVPGAAAGGTRAAPASTVARPGAVSRPSPRMAQTQAQEEVEEITMLAEDVEGEEQPEQAPPSLPIRPQPPRKVLATAAPRGRPVQTAAAARPLAPAPPPDTIGGYPDQVVLTTDSKGMKPPELRPIAESLGMPEYKARSRAVTMHGDIVNRLVNLGYSQRVKGDKIIFTSPQANFEEPSNVASTAGAGARPGGSTAIRGQVGSRLQLPKPHENVRVEKLVTGEQLPSLPGFEVFNVTSFGGSGLAPSNLGTFNLVEPWVNLPFYPDATHPGFDSDIYVDDNGQIYQHTVVDKFENYWLAGLIYDNDVNTAGEVQQSYFERRGKLLSAAEVQRPHTTKSPIGAFFDGKFMEQVAARKYYFTGYAMLAARTAEYQELHDFVVSGKALIVGYDGYDIGDTTNFDNVEAAFLNADKKFGYELVLACMLTGVFPREVYPLYLGDVDGAEEGELA